MNQILAVLLVGGILSVVIGIIFAVRQYEKKRVTDLKAFADSIGLPFFPQGDPNLVNSLSQFNLFSQGRNRLVSNMIHGDTDDVDMAIFDYRYTTGSGKHQHTWNQTVVYFESPLLALADFTVRPEGFFQKIGKIVGLNDIDFESHPEFSSKFWLQGSNEPMVRQLFRPEVLQWFQAQESISAEGMGSRLIIYRAGRRTSPEHMQGYMKVAFDLYGLLRQKDKGEPKE
jgi:hypothetical protein